MYNVQRTMTRTMCTEQFTLYNVHGTMYIQKLYNKHVT